jgi:transcription antitermination factor NusG
MSTWFATYVRPRHEARVAEHLGAREIDYFLPQFLSERTWKDRKVDLLMPLFPGYVFVNVLPMEKSEVLEVPGVLMMIKEAMPAEEIERLKSMGKFEQKEFNPQPHAYIAMGERVRVVRGPLKGTEGILVRGKKRTRVVISLDLIKKSMSVEVDADAIEPA